MKLIVTMGAAAAALVSVAYAGEWADACVARLEADGRNTSGCQCLEDAIAANSALEEEFRALAEIADPKARYEAASADARAAMDDCTR
jgi:hypothetical protein